MSEKPIEIHCAVCIHNEWKKIGAHHRSPSIEWIIKILLLPLKIIIYNQNSIKHSRKITAVKKTIPDRLAGGGKRKFKCSKLNFFPSSLWRSHLRWPWFSFCCFFSSTYSIEAITRPYQYSLILFNLHFAVSIHLNSLFNCNRMANCSNFNWKAIAMQP